MKREKTTTRTEALKIARYMGCRGAHQFEGNWMPCADHATLIRISTAAEKSLESEFSPRRKRRKKGKKRNDGWERLGQRGVLSIDGLSGGGIVSGGGMAFGKAKTGPCWPGYMMVGRKPGKNGRTVPNCVPIEQKAERRIRNTDPDVYTSRESARVRARQLGCIGIRQYSSYSGGTAWMPCTNESDYRRAMGVSPQGRRDVAKRQLAEMRRALRRLERRKKSEFTFKAASASKTPAPKKDRIIGSSRNARGTAASRSSASEIDLSKQTVASLQTSMKRHNSRMDELNKPEWSKASLNQLKAVWRRGAGAFSVSHRPGMTRSQWAFARVRAFLWMLEKGKPKKLTYITDRDLLVDSHPFKKNRLSKKSVVLLASERNIEIKARFIRASKLGPKISRRRTAIFRKPKTDIDGDGDGFRWNPATGLDDLPVNFGKRTVAAKKSPRPKGEIDDDKLIELINSGHSIAAIEKYFGVKSPAIFSRLKKIDPKKFTATPSGTRRSVGVKPLNDEEIKRIAELGELGKSASEIAQNLGLPPVLVDRALMRLKRRGEVIPNITSGERRRGRTQQLNRADEIAKLYNQGKSIDEIAEKLGRTYQNVATAVSNLRKQGRIEGPARQRRRRRVDFVSSKTKIPVEKIPELKEKYHSLRQSMSKTRATAWLAREFGADSSTVRNALGADYLKDSAGTVVEGVSRRGTRPKFSDVEKRRIQLEYAELLKDMNVSSARSFLAEYYDASPGTIKNIVGRGKPEFFEGEFTPPKAGPPRGQRPKISARDNQIVAMVKMGRSTREIAESLGVTQDVVRVAKSRLGKSGRLSPDEARPSAFRRRRMIELYNEGASPEEIADELGLSISSVKPMLTRLRRQNLVGNRKTTRKLGRPKSKERADKVSQIIDLLAEDPNMKVADIAERTGISSPLIFETIRELKEQGLIERTLRRGVPKGTPRPPGQPRKPRPSKTASLSDESARVRSLYLQGLNRAEMSRELGMSVGKINKIMQSLFRDRAISGDDIAERTRNTLPNRRAAKRSSKSLFSLSLPDRFISARLEIKELGARIDGQTSSRNGASTTRSNKPNNRPNNKPNKKPGASGSTSTNFVVAYDPNAVDADGDGIVQEGTNQQRNVNDSKPPAQTTPRRSVTADSAERNAKKPTAKEKEELDKVNWQQFTELVRSETAKLKPGQQTNWNVGRLPNGGFIDIRRRYIPPPAVAGTIETGSQDRFNAIHFRENGFEVLIPTVGPNGESWDASTEEGMAAALSNYRQTGRHLGKFNSESEARAYQDWLRTEERTTTTSSQEENNTGTTGGNRDGSEGPKRNGQTDNSPSTGQTRDGSEGPKRRGGQGDQPEQDEPNDGSEGPKRQGDSTGEPKQPDDGSEGPKREGSTNTGPKQPSDGSEGPKREGDTSVEPKRPTDASEGPKRQGDPREEADQPRGGRGDSINTVGQAGGQRPGSEIDEESLPDNVQTTTANTPDWHQGNYDSNFINMDFPGRSWIQADINFSNYSEDDENKYNDLFRLYDMPIVQDLPEGKFITFSNSKETDLHTAIENGVVFKWKGIAHIIEMDESEAAWLNQVNNAALNNTGGRSIGDPLNEGPLANQLQNIKTMSRVYDLLPESMHTINALIYQKGEGRKWAEEYGISPAGFANQADRDSFTFANGYGENSYSKEVFIHEFAHTLDFARDLASYSPKYRPNWLLESDEAFLNDLAADRHGKSSAWKAARQEDALNLMNLGLAEKYSFESGDVSHYGMKNEYEDFAESFTHYILDKIDGYYRTVDDKAYSFADMFPGRAKYFDTWIEWAKSVKPANVDDFENSHVTPQPMHTHPHE